MRNVFTIGMVAYMALVTVLATTTANAAEAKNGAARVDATKITDIKAYCIDLNWEKVYNRPKLAIDLRQQMLPSVQPEEPPLHSKRVLLFNNIIR